MKYYRPTIITRRTQEFGQNLNNYYAQLGLLGHNGIDYACPEGTELRSPAYTRAYVSCASFHANYGNRVVLIVRDPDSGKYYKLYFGHLRDMAVKVGDYVDTGDLMGHTGNTGTASTGPHLHFGVYECDAGGNIKNYRNGYEGALDPDKFLIDQYVLEALIDQQKQVVSLLQRIIEVMKQLLQRK
jgi:murein DD-endopeptidase MepM/ murein hydrolase activator NlpD